MEQHSGTRRVSPLMGTERAFFEDRKESLRAEYESHVQGLVANWEASAGAVSILRRKRFRAVHIATFFGGISFRCREGICTKGLWKCPALAHLGIRPNQWFSPDTEKRIAVLAAETGSYKKAASVADATWLAASDGSVRAAVLRLGEAAKDCQPGHPCAGAAGPEDTLVVMADGWFARHRGCNWGLDKRNRKMPERVHWSEIRSAVVFKLSALLAVSGKRKAIMDKHVVAVPADTTPYDFGLLLQQEMERMGARLAKAVIFVMDGGVWLWTIHNDRFKQCSKAMLDFYHLSQHLHALSDAVHPGDKDAARDWCSHILHSLKHHSPKKLFTTLAQILEAPPAEDRAVRETVRREAAYLTSHIDHMQYAKHRKEGIPIGSGSVESLCSQLQNRLKRTGQFWTKQGFAAILLVVVRHWNGELDSLWMASAA